MKPTALVFKGKKHELSVYFESTDKSTFVADVADKARAFEALYGVKPVVYVHGGYFKLFGVRYGFLPSFRPGIEVTGFTRRYFEGIADGKVCKFGVVDHNIDAYCCYLKHPKAVNR